MYKKVKETIQRRVQIPDKDLEKSFAYSSVCDYKKGDQILSKSQSEALFEAM